MNDMRGPARAFAILRVLGARRRSTLSDVARETELPKPTALRFLRALETDGWITHDDGGYRLGPAILGLAGQYMSADEIIHAASPAMSRLRDESGETATLSRISGSTRICVQEFPSEQHLRLVFGLGERSPLHAGASGLVLLAYVSPERRRQLLDQPLDQMTERTLTDIGDIEEACARIREQGYSITHGQRTAGGAAIAVPLVDPAAEGGYSALGIYGPEVRCRTAEDEQRWLDAVRACAREIGAEVPAAT